ncbi:MAG: tetratricopeptide repeat protein [bacterium]|nr:tetratricopeptide repeat protein [bacterium]
MPCLIALAACGGGGPELAPAPTLELDSMEPRVARLLGDRLAGVTSAPRSAQAWTQLGFALDAHSMLDEAEMCLANAVALDTGAFEAAYMYAFLGDLNGCGADEIERRFHVALSSRSDYAPAHVRLGDARNRAGRSELAREAYERALELDPFYGKAHSRLGALLASEKGTAAAAIAHLEKARAEAPDDRPTIAALAQAYGQAGRADDARAAAVRAPKLERPTLSFKDPIHAGILASAVSSLAALQRAQRAIRSRDYAAAVRDLEIFVEARPEEPEGFARLALAKLKLGRIEESANHLDAALALEPTNTEANVLMGQIEVERGELANATARFERVFDGETLDPDTHFAWGVALARQSRYEEAIVQFDTVIRLRPKDRQGRDLAVTKDSLFLRAMALELTGSVPQAIEAYREAIALAPQHPLAKRLPPLLAR